jgi:hypothetical protein
LKRQNFITHSQHSEDASFIAPRKLQYPDSYRVLDNEGKITLQAHFSVPQERCGSIQEHGL